MDIRLLANNNLKWYETFYFSFNGPLTIRNHSLPILYLALNRSSGDIAVNQ